MNHPVRILPAAQRDIEAALRFTLREFGEHQYAQYRSLIHQAIADIAANPDDIHAKRRPEIHDQARTFHIARPGRRARHFLLFRVADDGIVEIARLLYDGMELSAHLPPKYRPEDETA